MGERARRAEKRDGERLLEGAACRDDLAIDGPKGFRRQRPLPQRGETLENRPLPFRGKIVRSRIRLMAPDFRGYGCTPIEELNDTIVNGIDFFTQVMDRHVA